MPGFEPQAKSQGGARGFRPAMAAALAQAQNQAPDSIPAMVKPGEFVLPPDTVHAVGGAQALQGVVDATHTPARGFAPQAQPEEPRQFFANGGPVEDESIKRPGITGAAPANWSDTIAKVEAMGFKQRPAQLLGEPGATTAERGFAPTGIAAQPAAEDSAGAGRGFVKPAAAPTTSLGAAKPGTPEVMAGVFQHGRGQYSDNASGMGFAPGFTGQPSAQNMEAADTLASRQQQESVNRVAAHGFATGGGHGSGTVESGSFTGGFSGVIGSSSTYGNMRGRSPEQQRRDAEVSAGSIHGPTAAAGKAALAALNGMDLQGARNAGELAVANATQQGSIQREGMQQAGETQRSRLQHALADIRERRTAQQQDTQNNIARQRLAIDAARLGRDGTPSGYRPKADGTGLEYIPGGPADPGRSKEAVQRGNDAQDVLSILAQARPLVEASTGSYAGAAVDKAAQVFGVSTPGADAAAQLKALQGALVSKMPKMSGPQSDKDVQLYREMAGQIGDSTIPARQRLAAMKTVEGLHSKYAPADAAYQVPQQQGEQRAVARTGTINGRKVVQYSDGSISYAD